MKTLLLELCFVAIGLGVQTADAAVGVVPKGYTRPKYIQGTGEQWIHSNYTPGKTDRFEMKVNFTDVSTIQVLYCSRKAVTSQTTSGFLLSFVR